MRNRRFSRAFGAIALAGVPLVTIASCDPATGFFDFYRDDDADDCCDDFGDFVDSFDDGHNHYDEDCFLFVCF